MNKTEFVILRVNGELKDRILKKAKSLKTSVSKVIREIIEKNL